MGVEAAECEKWRLGSWQAAQRSSAVDSSGGGRQAGSGAALLASSAPRSPHQTAHSPSSSVKKQELGPNCQAAKTVVENTHEQRKSTRRIGMRSSL